MPGVIPIVPRFKFFDASGNPLALGSVTVYEAGSSTLANTFQDKDLQVANTNPVNLDANGECLFFVDDSRDYKFELTTGLNGTGATVTGWPVDNILTSGPNGFTQSGTGAIRRSTQDKLSEFVSVLDYINDTQKEYILARNADDMDAAVVRAGIQKCFDAVNSVAVKTRRVYFPGGLYLVDQMLYLYSRMELAGDGAATVLRNVNDGSVSSTRQGVFAHGHYATPGVDDIDAECDNHSYAVNAIAAAGASTFTLTTLGNAANFAVDQIVFIHNGVEKQYGASQAKTREEIEVRRVTSVDTGTGVVTLDKPLLRAHATAYATISGKAQIKAGPNEPAGHYVGILDRLYIHDMRLEFRGWMGLPGSVYDCVFERVQSDGPFGYSVNFSFSSVVRGCKFTCGLRAIELAMGQENLIEDNDCYLDDERVYDAGVTAVYGLLTTQGSRNNLIRGNRVWSTVEAQPIFDGGGGLFGDTHDNTFVDNYFVRTATTTVQSYGDVSLVNSTNSRVLRNTFIGGNKFHHTFSAAVNFEVDGNRHLAQVITPEQAHNFQAAGAGCSGYIRNGEHDGALSFDINPGLSVSLLTVHVEDNWYRGTVASKTSHPNFTGARYDHQLSSVKAVATFTASDTTEQTIFSHTIAAQAKMYSRYDAEFWAIDTGVPTTNKTMKLYDGATLLDTITLPSAFGRARTRVRLQVISVNDISVHFLWEAKQFPYAGGGTAAVLGWATTVSTTSSTAHQPKITLQAAGTSPFSVTGVQLARTGCAGGTWEA